MNNGYPQTPGMNSPQGIPEDYPYRPSPIPTSNPGVGFVPNISASPYPSTAFTSGNPSNSSYPAASSSYLLVPNNPYLVFASPYPASTSQYPASPYSAYPASTSAFPTSSNSCYPASSNSPHPAPTSTYPSSSNRQYPASTSSYLATSYPTPASTNQSPSSSPYPSMGSRAYYNKFRPSIRSNRYPQTPSINPPPGISRDYLYRPTPMPTSNPSYPSGVGFAPNVSASPYPSAAFTSGNPSNSSCPAASSSYLLVPNNPYLVCTSPYPASFNNPYPALISHYPASSNSAYLAFVSAFPTSCNSCYPTSCNSLYPAPTTTYHSNRHYSASTSSYLATSYPAPASANKPPGASPYPSMASRVYDSMFRPSVNETNDDAFNINAFPNEIILKVFGFLTQNQLGQIARVCRRWNALTKSPALWKRVNVKFSPSTRCRTTVPESFINGLPSCVTSIRLHCTQYRDGRWTRALYFEELCAKLQQKCPHLEELMLVDFKLLDSLPAAIDLCTQFLLNLKNLVFRNCIFLECRERAEFGGILKIEVLDLSGCNFRYNKLQFSRMPCLKVLRLYRTYAWDSWFEDDTSFLNQLHVLDVGFTDITTRIAAIIFQAIQYHGLNLKELYLCCAYLQNHDMTFNNSTFPHLKTICVADTWVSCEGVLSLIQSCPSVENVYVGEDVAESFAAHPFVVANRCKSGIVKADSYHKHNVNYLHN